MPQIGPAKSYQIKAAAKFVKHRVPKIPANGIWELYVKEGKTRGDGTSRVKCVAVVKGSQKDAKKAAKSWSHDNHGKRVHIQLKKD